MSQIAADSDILGWKPELVTQAQGYTEIDPGMLICLELWAPTWAQMLPIDFFSDSKDHDEDICGQCLIVYRVKSHSFNEIHYRDLKNIFKKY